MTASTMTSREFNQDASRAKRAAEAGPVFITDRGSPAHVLMSMAAYEALVGDGSNIAELLALPGVEDIDFDPPRDRSPARPAAFD